MVLSISSFSQDKEEDPNGPQETCEGDCSGGGETFDGWLWEEYTIDCTVTWSFKFEPFGIGGSYSETTPGTKDRCKDGNNLCWKDFLCST